MTTVSPFARSSAFDEPRLQGREQTVRIKIRTMSRMSSHAHLRLRKCTAFRRVS